MKRFLAVLLAMGLLLCGCRRLEQDTDQDDIAQSEPNFTIEYATDAETKAEIDNRTVVCIDAGHGFGDVGCTSDYLGMYEYEVTIDVAKKLKTALEAKGVEVILTHDGESYPPEANILAGCVKHGIDYKPEAIKENGIFSAYERALYEEILIIEESVDFFISIHVNSVEHAEYVDGYELYYCNDNPNKHNIEVFGNNLGALLDNELKCVGYDYDEAYIVTKYTSIPSVLLEIGYATNKEDARKMNDDAWKNQLSENLASEIQKYLTK